MDERAKDFDIEKYKKLKDLFYEPGIKLLHGTNIDCVDAIQNDGLWVFFSYLEHTTREVDTNIDHPSLLADYFYTAPFEPYDESYHRNIIVGLPFELGKEIEDPDFRERVVEYSGELSKGQHVHYSGTRRRIIAPEFIRGMTAPIGDFVANPKWIKGLKNAEQMIEWHRKRMNSRTPMDCKQRRPQLELQDLAKR